MVRARQFSSELCVVKRSRVEHLAGCLTCQSKKAAPSKRTVSPIGSSMPQGFLRTQTEALAWNLTYPGVSGMGAAAGTIPLPRVPSYTDTQADGDCTERTEDVWRAVRR